MAQPNLHVALTLCFLAAVCGDHASLQQACAAGRGAACPIFDDADPLALVQSRASNIVAKGSAGDRMANVAAKGPTGTIVPEPVLLAMKQEGQEKKLEHLSGGGAGASAASSGGRGRGAAGEKIGARTLCTWAVTAAVLLMLVGLLTMGGSPDGEPLLPMIVAEFVGTFMLVFSVGCNVLVGDPTWAVLSIACTLMVSIYALGGVSGGNFNPAVSCAIALSGKMPVKKCTIYVCTQLAAGIVAGLAYGLMLGETFDLGPADGFTAMEAGLAEIFYTWMLCFCVLNTAVSRDHAGKHQFYGLAIGFSVVAGGYGGGSISGGCFNPAVAVGIDSSSSGAGGFGWCLAYFAFEIAGAVLAATLFRACRPNDFAQNPSDSEPKLGVRLLSEFLGTFMLVLTVGLNVLAASPAAVFSIAASLMCMIFALGSVSGAHFNPAVTFAIYLSGREKISWADAVAYVISQVTAGIIAALTYVAMHNGRSVSLKPSASAGEALFGEMIFTFLLSFVVLSVATTQSPLSHYFGLAIGSCVTAGGLAIGSLSGGSLNPAVSAGLAFSDLVNGGPLAWLPSYATAELAGGALAAIAFRATHVGEYGGKQAS